MSIDQFFGREYHARRYNCAHFVCDVWRDLKSTELGDVLSGFLCGPRDRQATLSDLRRIRFIDKSESPCIVLMQAPRQPTHVGVWVRGRVLHLIENRGVQYQPLEIVAWGFQRVRFFTC